MCLLLLQENCSLEYCTKKNKNNNVSRGKKEVLHQHLHNDFLTLDRVVVTDT